MTFDSKRIIQKVDPSSACEWNILYAWLDLTGLLSTRLTLDIYKINLGERKKQKNVSLMCEGTKQTYEENERTQ